MENRKEEFKMDNFGQNLKNYLNCDANEIFKAKNSKLEGLYNFRKICLLIGIIFLIFANFIHNFF